MRGRRANKSTPSAISLPLPCTPPCHAARRKKDSPNQIKNKAEQKKLAQEQYEKM
jgi:hypothetical protein